MRVVFGNERVLPCLCSGLRASLAASNCERTDITKPSLYAFIISRPAAAASAADALGARLATRATFTQINKSRALFKKRPLSCRVIPYGCPSKNERRFFCTLHTRNAILLARHSALSFAPVAGQARPCKKERVVGEGAKAYLRVKRDDTFPAAFAHWRRTFRQTCLIK